MKMKKLYRNKRGLSTVISTILMIMVVMVGMSVAFASVVEYANSYRAGVGSSVLESLTVEDTWLHNNTEGVNVVDLWIYNVGSIPVNVKAIYVNNVPLNVTGFVSYPVSGPEADKEISSEDVLNINGPIGTDGHAHVTAMFDWQSVGNGHIDFKIATERGSVFDQQYQ